MSQIIASPRIIRAPAQVLITKADGEQEAFDPAKLEYSLERAGASSTMRGRIAARVMREIKTGMTTEEIYRQAFDMLRKEEVPPVAARYSVKRAVLDRKSTRLKSSHSQISYAVFCLKKTK